MERHDLLNIINKPKNEDVIIYDIGLSELIDVDVFQEYYNDYAAFKLKKENFLLISDEIKEYEKSLNDIYLYKKNWTEIDYIEMLKKDKQQYATLYKDIQKIENKMQILEKKYISTNEQIEIQRAKDLKEIEDKKNNIDEENEKLKENITNVRLKINDIEINLDKINKEIQENELEKEDILLMINSIDQDAYVCQYCGTKITHASSKKRINNLLQKNLEKNVKDNKVLKTEKNKIENDLTYFKNELSKYKSNLRNNLEFKKQDYNFYIKKSLAVLKLEAIRDNILKQKNEATKEYNSNSKIKTQQYQELKDRMEKYELSLQNIKKIKEGKEKFQEKYKKYNELKAECITLKNNLDKYKKFITIFYKIYQQKINDYFGQDFNFNFYRFNDYELEEIFEVKYKGINYNELGSALRKEFDEIYLEKIKYFS